MPRIWRYLLISFFKIFSLCFLGTIGVGLLLKYKKYAYLITAGASFSDSFLLICCYISYLLPLLIGISALIAAFLTTNHLSTSHEITALRTSGMSFTQILIPFYILAVALSVLNFFITSELIPSARLIANNLIYKSSINPLVLLRKNEFSLFENSHIEMKLRDNGRLAKDVLLIFNNQQTDTLTLISAERLLFSKNSTLEGENISLITHLKSDYEGFDHLIIDNQKAIMFPVSFFNSLLKGKNHTKEYEVYPLKKLLTSEDQKLKKDIPQRIAKGLFPLTFIILGASFGLFITRKTKEKQFLCFSALVFFQFLCYIIGQNSQYPWFLTTLFILIANIFVIFFALNHQNQLKNGIS